MAWTHSSSSILHPGGM